MEIHTREHECVLPRIPFSTKVTSTSESSTTSMAKTTEANKAATDASNREMSMEIMKHITNK